ncbi:MAG TPA: prephenate dehydrogenase/arogenate dehydrogenase family protein [Candidatus Tumulicola sp.]|nr:prephenate dehydrogenase/arogenate dehydrogenase family protein [Candidatus Tumulicola sp.]
MNRQSIAIIGTGLIGASLGLALRRKSSAIVGWDRKRANAREAKRRGAITRIAASLEDAVRDAAVVVLAAPLPEILKMLPRVLRMARSSALVIDVGGLKVPVVREAERALRRQSRTKVRHTTARARNAYFVAGHPLAGNERSGPGAARADLFQGMPFALYAPAQPERASARRAAERFVRRLGAKPVWVPPAEHDRIVSVTSALPQLASTALALAWRDAGGPAAGKLAGPGLRGATRLADSPFLVWKASLLGNRGNVRRALLALKRRVDMLAKALNGRHERQLAQLFAAGAGARRRILQPARRKTAATHRY